MTGNPRYYSHDKSKSVTIQLVRNDHLLQSPKNCYRLHKKSPLQSESCQHRWTQTAKFLNLYSVYLPIYTQIFMEISFLRVIGTKVLNTFLISDMRATC